MRARTLVPLSLLGGVALLVGAATPAYAADTTWTSPSDSWWSTATWSTTVPGAGDNVTFAGGDRSTYNLGDVNFGWFDFTNDHRIANGGGWIGLSNGLDVVAGADVVIESGINVVDWQTWTVESGATLTLPSQVNIGAELTLDVEGSIHVTTGNLDGLGTACIQKYGPGLIEFAGGGGGVGSCDGGPEGLRVAEGEALLLPGAAMGGKSLLVAEVGLLTGGDLAAPSIVKQLNLESDGTISPGVGSGTGFGQIDFWGGSTWYEGTYEVDWDPATGESDLIRGDGQPINVTNTVLAPRVASGASPTTTPFTVLTASGGVTGSFVSPAGDVLASGDTFVSDGQVFRYESTGTNVTLTWVSSVSTTTATPTITTTATATGTPDATHSITPAPTSTGGDDLAKTGADGIIPLLGAAGIVIGVAGLLLLQRKVKRA